MRKISLLAGCGLLATASAYAWTSIEKPEVSPEPTFIRVGDAVINATPGSTTCITRIDANGNVTNETLSIPETPEMLRAKERYMENATKYTLTITSQPDAYGQNAAPDVVYVMKDQYMLWKVEHEVVNTFELPEGVYNIQVVYGDDSHSNVFFPNIDLNADKNLTVCADMADKRVSFRTYMPDGSPMILPIDNPQEEDRSTYNTTMVTCLQSALVNGCSQWTQSVTTSINGAEYYRSFTLKSNFGEDTLAFWLEMTYDTDFGNLGVAVTKPGEELTDGMVVSNNYEDYFEASADFQRTPLYYEKGNDNTGLGVNLDLYRPDNAVLVGLGITVWNPHGFHICTALNDLDDYHTLTYVKNVEQYNQYGPKWGILSPVMIPTEDGLTYLCSQVESKYNVSTEPSYAGAPLNPNFSFPYENYYVMGYTTPYACTVADPAHIGGTDYYNYSVAAYYGNYGENRQVDAQNYTEQVSLNGEPVDLSGYRNVNAWLADRAAAGGAPGLIEITYTDDNQYTYDEQYIDSSNESKALASNVCTISYSEDSEDRVPPTVQRVMIRDAKGIPSHIVCEPEYNQPTKLIGTLAIAGGDFAPKVNDTNLGAYNINFTTYEYAPASLKVECRKTGSEDDYTELEMTEYPEKYVESYGSYWERTLKPEDFEDPGFYDLRITLEDNAGNKQIQVISPALLRDYLIGVENAVTDYEILSLVNGRIESSTGNSVSVYNLAGVKVINQALTPGVYVATSGSAKSKVIVR